MPASRLTGIALWGAWLAAGPAAGQETPIVDDSAMVVEIVAEAPRRTSADPKTELRLSGQDLAKQGVANLAEALELLPEVATHENRRGGLPVDIRGARQRAVMVIIDGVTVDEPWRGLFDLTSIPVTEIIELRVSTSPASPLDGAGGSGGVVEIATMRARGGRMLAGQARGSDAPELQLGATGRADLSRTFAIRVSLGGIANERTHDAIMPPPDNSVRKLDENRRAGYVSARVEGERGRARLIADLFGQHRRYLVPPDDETPAAVLVVDGEDSFRGVLGGDVDTGPWLLVARGYGQVLRRSSTSYPDASLMTESGDEELAADREGGMVEAERLIFPGPNVDSPPLRVGARLALDSEQARVESTAGGISNVDHGRSTVVQGATGAVWSVAGVTLDAAFGVAVPLVGDADPWPEAKLTVSYAPIAGLGLQAIGARKGRLPTLRERFDPLGGNPDLGPERISFAELNATARPLDPLEVKLAVYERYTEGLIRTAATSPRLTNVGDIEVHGVEAQASWGQRAPLGGGAAYNYAEASSPTLGPDPLDFVPQHRLEVWGQARYRHRAGAWARYRWIDDRLEAAQPCGTPPTVPCVLAPYSLVEASVWMQLLRDLRGSFRVDNLLDTDYRSRAGLLGEGRRFILVIDGVWR